MAFGGSDGPRRAVIQASRAEEEEEEKKEENDSVADVP